MSTAARPAAPAFVGRAAEVQAVRDALGRPPAVVRVEGVAGAGKSRLVRELLDGRDQHRVLLGACPPYREPATLAPVVDAVLSAGDQVARLRLSPLAGVLRPLFPEWAELLPPSPEPPADAAAARRRVFRALAELVQALAPATLVFEDAHWADQASLEFLPYLFARQTAQRRDRPEPEPLDLVLTYRPEELSTGCPLWSLPSRLPEGVRSTRLVIPPLDLAGTTALVSSMLGGASVSGQFAEFLHAHTGGLPLAVEESVQLLAARADLVHRDGEWDRRSTAVIQVPASIRGATLERVQRLDPAARRVLQAAAVLAEPADERTLAGVAGLPVRAVTRAAATAVRCGLLRHVGERRYAFRHVLPARAVYETLPEPQQRRWHARAGRTLAQLAQPPLVRLARHFREAADTPRWIRYAERAADVAAASGDHFAAFDLLEPLLTVQAVAPAERARLARKVASTALLRQVFVDGRARALAATLRSVRDTDGLAAVPRAELGNLLGRLLNQLGDHDEGFAELVRAVPRLGHDPVEAARSLVHLGWPRAGPWPARVHLRYLRQIESLPLAAMEPADRISITVDRAVALLQLGAAEGWSLVSDLPAEAEGAEERLHLARGYLNLGDAALLWGRYAEARRLLHRSLALAETGELDRVHYGAQVTQAHLDWLTGGWGDLPERLRRLVDAPDANPSIRDEAALVAVLRRAADGATEDAAEELARLAREAHQRGAASMALAPTAALARLRLDQGRPDLARDLTGEPLRLIAGKQIWVWATELVTVRTAALLATGAVYEARQLVSGFAAGLRRRSAPAPRAALATCRALLAEADAGPVAGAAAFGRAARAWESLPRPYEALRARERQAVALRAASRQWEATDLLTGVLRGFAGLGARMDADRVAGELRRLGTATGRLWWGGSHGYGDELSPREREVAGLVATGRTNREIAGLLGKATGTVAQQVSSVMRKLGVTSRTALAVRVREGALRSSGEGTQEQGSLAPAA